MDNKAFGEFDINKHVKEMPEGIDVEINGEGYKLHDPYNTDDWGKPSNLDFID